MRHLLFALIVSSLLSFSPQSLAGSASANLQVSVVVDSSCNISTSPLMFSDYNVLGANATSPDDGTGSVTIQCTNGVIANIGLDGGTAYSSGTNSSYMRDSVGHAIQYSLYQNLSRTTLWGNSSGSWLTTPAAPNTSPQTYTVYGRVPPGQLAPSGTYTDTVVATVNF